MNKVLAKTSLLLLIITTVSCGTKKNVVSKAVSEKAASVIANYKKASPKFETLQGRMRGSYKNENDEQSIAISFRIEKDKTIWLSAKLAGIIPLAKILITPNRVQYYEKIDGTYFDGDFSLLSQWLGTELNFNKVQNLLVGNTIYPIEEDYVELTTNQQGHKLSSPKTETIHKSFLIDTSSYRVKAQQLTKEKERENLTITYPDYQETNGQKFPKKIVIIANQQEKNTQITIDYRSIAVDESVSFPYNVPSGYKEISLQ